MSSEYFQPNDSSKSSDAKKRTHKPKWVMTQAAWDKLLNAFSADQEEAGRQYEQIRSKLIRIFEWNGVGPADELADETFNRVARHLEEGKEIDNLLGYIVGVAKVIVKEVKKKRKLMSLDETTESQLQAGPEPVEPDTRQRCFDRCLTALPSEKRYLIVEYYQDDKRDKIKRRQKLADEIGIPLNALRIRAHRIRVGLEKDINKCLETEPERND